MESYESHGQCHLEDTPLPQGWTEYLDSSTGATFYHNCVTQETQWERPQYLDSHEMSRDTHCEVKEILRNVHKRRRSKPTLEPLHTDYPPNYGSPHYQTHSVSPSHHFYINQIDGGHFYPSHNQDYNEHPHNQYNNNSFYHQPGKYESSASCCSPSSQHPNPAMQSFTTKRRTTVRLNSMKLSNILTKKDSKIHVQDDPATHHSAEESSSHSSCDTKHVKSNFHVMKEKKEALVGGKSQDYIGMVHQYKLQRPFVDRHHKINCVLCNKVVPEDIFFPCEHKVVCRGCIHREQVCADYDLAKFPNGHCNCPLCAAIIKLILPNEYGKEVEKYWDWVLAVKPELPQGFMRDFRHSAAIIQKIHIDENTRLRNQENRKCCTIS